MTIRMHRYPDGITGLAAFCDTCAEQITDGKGWIVWNGDDPTDFLIVHQSRCDPGGRGESVYAHSMPLAAEIVYPSEQRRRQSHEGTATRSDARLNRLNGYVRPLWLDSHAGRRGTNPPAHPPTPQVSPKPPHRAASSYMPIIRHGYAVRRNKDTYQRAKNRRNILANATTCGICGQPLRPDEPVEADHIVPVSHGGSDHPTNLRATHRTCNRRRGQG